MLMLRAQRRRDFGLKPPPRGDDVECHDADDAVRATNAMRASAHTPRSGPVEPTMRDDTFSKPLTRKPRWLRVMVMAPPLTRERFYSWPFERLRIQIGDKMIPFLIFLRHEYHSKMMFRGAPAFRAEYFLASRLRQLRMATFSPKYFTLTQARLMRARHIGRLRFFATTLSNISASRLHRYRSRSRPYIGDTRLGA